MRYPSHTHRPYWQTLLVLEVAPAAYINYAANEAEKVARWAPGWFRRCGHRRWIPCGR